jgi:Protein of unknown function (DUF4065)
MAARYAVSTAKVLEVILWLANERPGMDIYHVVKCAYYADKYHLNNYGRPIAGDSYQAANYGPLGTCLYGLLRGDPMELLALGGNGNLPFTVTSPGAEVTATREPNMRRLSESDVEALRWAVNRYADLSFDELYSMSHREFAYRNAEGGRIRYEDMLDPSPDLEERRKAIAETAPHAAL